MILTKDVWGDRSKPVTIVNVYVQGHLRENKTLWKGIMSCKREDVNSVRCTVGDFNVIRKSNEIKGFVQGKLRHQTMWFNRIIEEMDLMFIPMIGRRYT